MLAHEKLAKGDAFTIRKLEDRNQISSVQLDKRDKVEIRKVKEIGWHRGQQFYLKPTMTNFVAADAIMPPARGFQMIISMAHYKDFGSTRPQGHSYQIARHKCTYLISCLFSSGKQVLCKAI